MLPSGWYSNLITHNQQIVRMFGTTYYFKLLFFKMKPTMITLYIQLSNQHLSLFLLSTSSFYLEITSFVIANDIWCLIIKWWLLPCEFSCFFLSFYDCNFGSSQVNLCGSWAEKVGNPWFKELNIYCKCMNSNNFCL